MDNDIEGLELTCTPSEPRGEELIERQRLRCQGMPAEQRRAAERLWEDICSLLRAA